MSNLHSNGSRAGETEQMAAPQCLKIFIQRDYSEGTMVKFQTRFPPELDGRVSGMFRFIHHIGLVGIEITYQYILVCGKCEVME